MVLPQKLVHSACIFALVHVWFYSRQQVQTEYNTTGTAACFLQERTDYRLVKQYCWIHLTSLNSIHWFFFFRRLALRQNVQLFKCSKCSKYNFLNFLCKTSREQLIIANLSKRESLNIEKQHVTGTSQILWQPFLLTADFKWAKILYETVTLCFVPNQY